MAYLFFPFSFIHGGAWRDPNITASSFQPTIDALLLSSSSSSRPSTSYSSTSTSSSSKNVEDSTTPSSPLDKIAGLASLDYRLSAHPNYPQDPSSTPKSKLNNALHPDHVTDVRNGIHLLQSKFSFGSNYVLVGHSVGATLAFQMVMGDSVFQAGSPSKLLRSISSLAAASKGITPPTAIVGIAGVYAMRAMVDRHEHPAYREFVAGALGEDELVWDEVSPAFFDGYRETWTRAEKVVLAYSEEDALVEVEQVRDMKRKLEEGVTPKKVEEVRFTGGHDEVWEKGTQVAELILKVVGGS